MAAVASLNCIVCRKLGYGESPATVHHCGTHMGGGRDHMKVIPLCHLHHQGKEGIDGKYMSKRRWQQKYWSEYELLEEVAGLLRKQERVKV